MVNLRWTVSLLRGEWVFELASEYQECVLLQTWAETPTVNVRNGMRQKWELKRFPYFHVFSFHHHRPALFCVLATECPFTARRRPVALQSWTRSQAVSQPPVSPAELQIYEGHQCLR